MKPISRRAFLGYGGAAAATSLLGARAATRPADRREIVRYAIHPAIGVARIGDSQDGYFIGPETTEPAAEPGAAAPGGDEAGMRDPSGAIKRQAARFRIYGYNAQGEAVREITSDDARIEWRVHVANKKAAWYRFTVALDIADSSDVSVPLRNARIRGQARRALEIDPGPRTISGRGLSGDEFQFASGRFFDVPVYLGELRTDEKGRLLFLGGRGKSGRGPGAPGDFVVFDPNVADTFNNADGWYDDISDGPVEATVTIDGRTFEAESSWVVVAPPNFAPDVVGWRTLHDLLTNNYIASSAFVSEGMVIPPTTSFANDVLPLLHRLSNLQWVNKAFADLFGKGGELDFDDPSLIAKLSDKAKTGLRARVVRSFRMLQQDPRDHRLWPMLYGDAYGTFPDSNLINFVVTGINELHLKRFAEGNFVSDWDPIRPLVRKKLAELPVGSQPAMLDKAALHFCLADAFHPGCELTWPVRHVSMYERPFRIKRKPANARPEELPAALTQRSAFAENGPLYAQGPGDLTRWMAIPWQGDTVFCRSGYEPEIDPHLPTFWPARVPNHVLTAEDYAIVMDANRPREERIEAFRRRGHWVRNLNGSAPEQIEQAVRDFSALGVIEARPGLPNDPFFPPVIYVESLPDRTRSEPPPVGAVPAGGSASRRLPPDDPLSRAGWTSREQYEEFKRARRGAR